MTDADSLPQTAGSADGGSGRLIGRLPIRVRLTLAFALVIALVFALIGGALFLRFRDELDQQINQNLRSRAADVTALVSEADSGLAQSGRSPLARRAESFAQIIDRRGRVLDATTHVQGGALLSGTRLRAARSHTIIVERRVGSEPSRLLATPARAQDQLLVVVVGSSLGGRDAALGRLGALLLLGGPIAVLLALIAGYGLAAAALRPVDSMRRRAAQISAADPGTRLPVPRARDEISRLGTTLNDMLARLEASFARERRFVADASHELRTPLAILGAELELALRAGRSPADMHAALVSANEETLRMSRLAEDLLVIARADDGRLPVRLEAVELDEVVAQTVAQFRQRAADTARELSAAPTCEPIRVRADPARLRQALGNLAENALRHGGGAIVVSARLSDGSAILAVRDHGPGLADRFADVAFERFTRADGARGDGGAGLGLAIVAAIAVAHGGTAGARNAPGGGAEVWIALPLSGAGA